MTCIAVLGTHRTGTSTVAGILHYLGVNMGDNMKPAHPSNPKGHFEDMDFLLHNDKVVKNWKYPSLDITGPDLAVYMDLVREREKNPLWGIKDPRLCITLSWFHNFIGDLRIITTHRELRASAESLRAVHPMPLEEALEIQKYYLDVRESFLMNFDGPVLEIAYDDIIQYPKVMCSSIKKFSGATKSLDEALAFIDPELRHYGPQK